MDFKKEIGTYLEHEIETLRALDVEAINAALNLLLEAFENGNTIYIFGNGGRMILTRVFRSTPRRSSTFSASMIM